MAPDFGAEHVLAEGAAAPEGAVEVDVDDVQPMLVGHGFGRRFAAGNAGIVDEDVDLAVARRELIGHLGDARGIGHVHDDDLGVIALRLQAGATGLGHLGIAIGDHDLGAGLRQRLGAGKPDALPAAR